MMMVMKVDDDEDDVDIYAVAFCHSHNNLLILLNNKCNYVPDAWCFWVLAAGEAASAVAAAAAAAASCGKRDAKRCSDSGRDCGSGSQRSRRKLRN